MPVLGATIAAVLVVLLLANAWDGFDAGLIPDRLRNHQDRPPSAAQDAVELPRPPTQTPTPPAPAPPGSRDNGTAPTRASLPPACTQVGGEPCAAPLVDHDALLGAARISFGVVVIDRDLTLMRLQLSRHGTVLRWSSDLAADAGGQGAAAPVEPGQVHLARSGTVVLVGTSRQLVAVDSADGSVAWSTTLGEGPRAAAWQAWHVGATVLATNLDEVVALRGEDGAVRWRRREPARASSALASGIARLEGNRLVVLDATGPEPRWTRELDGPARLPRHASAPAPGPVVLVAERTWLLAADDGAVLADLGVGARATRTTAGQTVAAVWDDDGATSTLVGFGIDGLERWRVAGPEVACCNLELRALGDGRVAVHRPAAFGDESAWVLDPATGRVLLRLIRPADVAWIPLTVAGDTAVWRDGGAYVGAGPSGEPRWRAESQAILLSEVPLLLATRDGLIDPTDVGGEAHG